MWLRSGGLSVILVCLYAVLIVADALLVHEDSALMVSSFHPDDGRATNPSSTQEAIAQVRRLLPTAEGHLSPSGVVVELSPHSHLHFSAFPPRSIISRSSRTSKTSPSPGTLLLMIRQMGTLSLCGKQRRTYPSPKITPTRNVMLSCTTSLSEQQNKNSIGHSKTMKSLLHCPTSESFLNL